MRGNDRENNCHGYCIKRRLTGARRGVFGYCPRNCPNRSDLAEGALIDSARAVGELYVMGTAETTTDSAEPPGCKAIISCAADEVLRQELDILWRGHEQALAAHARRLAHDIRVKLTAVLGNASLIERSDDASSVHRWASRIGEAAEGVGEIADQLSELVTRYREVNAIASSPAELTREVIDRIESLAGTPGSIDYEFDPDSAELVSVNPGAVRAMVADVIVRLGGSPLRLRLRSRVGNSGGRSRVLEWTGAPITEWAVHAPHDALTIAERRLHSLAAAILGSEITFSTDGKARCEVVTEAI